jgi:uncharacterized membrane protein YbhN (UPF0104 family)
VGTLAFRTAALAGSRAARAAFVVVTVGLAVWAILASRAEVADALRRLSPDSVWLAAVLTLGNVLLAGMVWRTVLADLGSRLPLRVAARVFYVGQLGKYLPGSVWPVVAQAELGRDYRVPRSRTATATAATLLLSVASALALVVAMLPFVPGLVPRRYAWVQFLLLPMLVALHPAVLGRAINRGLKMIGRPPLERPTSLAGTARAIGWAWGSWICAGLQVWILAVSLGAPLTPRVVALAVGGYVLAWAVGFLVVISPAGAGVREVVLAAVLSGVLDRGAVVVVVLLSRVLFTLADLALAAFGVAAERRVAFHRRDHAPDAAVPERDLET